ncbi:hypothetical protein QFC21_001910 [Naganishia friedmannii]|uniref:Uncharacterized protein n=1 Tax=Naganishia friedmannii TaxID=89922 RepID=A0ACC2VZW0_9TREE|nr:hypothetical protein QFC21_001910 [Naganishia friedmannii]
MSTSLRVVESYAWHQLEYLAHKPGLEIGMKIAAQVVLVRLTDLRYAIGRQPTAEVVSWEHQFVHMEIVELSRFIRLALINCITTNASRVSQMPTEGGPLSKEMYILYKLPAIAPARMRKLRSWIRKMHM